MANAGKARFAPGAGDYTLSNTARNWRTIARPVSQPVAPIDPILGFAIGGSHTLAKLVFTTPQNNTEVGVWVGDKSLGNYLLLGLKQDGVFKVVTESFIAGVSQGLVAQVALGANPAAIWLHLSQATEGFSAGQWVPKWSTVGPFTTVSTGAAITFTNQIHWSGLYLRGQPVAGTVADFDDFILWTPNGTRPFNAYVFRDPGLGGQPDLEAAHSVIHEIKHAFTHATIITSRAVLCDDPGSGCDRGPMGAL